jgi:2-haloacid dehalogenase
MLENIKALTFDTGGTILDWHHGLSRAFATAGARHGLRADWPAITNAYRRRSLQAMLDAEHPTFTIDDVHHEMLNTVVTEFGLQAFTTEDREAIWRTWHALDAWPDFVPALARLRAKYVVVSFTILTTSLVIDVSRRNNITWDCLISCEMIGMYKPRREAYQTAARWLALAPHEILTWWPATTSTSWPRVPPAIIAPSCGVPRSGGRAVPLIQYPIQPMTWSSTRSSPWPGSSALEHCQAASVERQWHTFHDVPR